jgi:hypothetical protein
VRQDEHIAEEEVRLDRRETVAFDSDSYFRMPLPHKITTIQQQ